VGRLAYLGGMNYIEVPEAIVKKLGGLNKQRLLCSVNGKPHFSCGLMALRDGKAYIMFSKKRMKEAGVDVEDKIDVVLEPDHSEFGMELSDELREVLESDPEAESRFRNLTPGKQRNIIHYVSQVKSPQLRVDRALKLMNNLKALPPGKETVRAIFLGHD
jgi:hypothetical protein